MLKKLWLLAALLLAMTMGLSGAEYRDSTLFLEINLADGKNLELESPDGFRIIDGEFDFSTPFASRMRIELSNQNLQSFWGLVNRTSVDIEADTSGTLASEQTLSWSEGRLKVLTKHYRFEDNFFASYDEAKEYAVETGYPSRLIRAIPMHGVSVVVTDAAKSKQYYELPLTLETDGLLKINGQQSYCRGRFVIRCSSGRLVINHYVALEAYVAGVVPNEIGNNAPMEALKAQAVAARTHAFSLLTYSQHRDDGYDLCDGVHCQVYKGEYLQNEVIQQAVIETEAEILTYHDGIADGVYHSNCGGKTDSSENIWNGKPIDYLMGVVCYPELDSVDLTIEANVRKWINKKQYSEGMSSWERKSINWEKTLSIGALESAAGVSGLREIEIVKRGFSGRILKLKFIGNSTVTVSKEMTIRKIFGNAASSFFYIAGDYSFRNGNVVYPLNGTVRIVGKGFGHGVGMCQIGALDMARKGIGYHDILGHYYPGTQISNSWRE